jgi:light-harvesting complex II chlorophyll a/b binding protein 7
VQALADSKYGKKLLEDLKAQRPSLVAAAAALEKSRAAARAQSTWYGPNRPQWLGPLSQPPPEWLDGVLPGDYGYDPLALGKEKEKLNKYVELELLHARWAMLGGLGALIPEALQLSGKTQFLEPVWWRVGAAKLHSTEDLNYLGIAGLKVAGGQGVLIIALCQVLLMFGPEYARACGIEALEPLGIFFPGDKNYPGGWLFDPLGLSTKSPESYEAMRVREIKNGRLAMVAWLGFAAQAAVTGKGPLENVLDTIR